MGECYFFPLVLASVPLHKKGCRTTLEIGTVYQLLVTASRDSISPGLSFDNAFIQSPRADLPYSIVPANTS